MSGAAVVAGLVSAVILLAYLLVRQKWARLDRGVTFRVWASGFGVLVIAGKWTHAHRTADWPWIQSVVVGVGVVLTALWLDEDAPLRRQR